MARIPLSSLPNGTVLRKGSFLPAAGATAQVFTHGTASPVTVFSAETGAGTLSLPISADANGQLPGWVNAGQDLDIVATFAGITAPAAMAEPLFGSTFMVGAPSGDATGATDLSSIQAAINLASAAGGVAQLRAGQTYTISTPGLKTITTPSGGSTNLAFGLDIPSGVTLDLNGAQVKAASGSLGILIINRNPTNGGGDVNVGLTSSTGLGIIDGNNQIPAVGARSMVMILFSTAPTASNLLIRNGYTGGLQVYGNTRGNYDLITTDTIRGGGVDLGQPFPNALENQATVGRLFTANTSAEPSNTFFNPGNGVYLAMSNSTIDTLFSLNNTGGDKLDRPSQDVLIKAVYGINNGDSGGNSGFKFQGGTASTSATTSNSVARCSIGLLHMVNQNGTGLFMQGCIDCTVTKYIGENNALAGGLPDVWLGGVRDRVDNLFSDKSFIGAVEVRTDVVEPSIGRMVIRNPNQSNTASVAALRQEGGTLTVDKIVCIDELDFPVNVTATASAGGGTFAGGVAQFYMITYLNASGETTGSYEMTATPAASGKVVLTWGTGALPTGTTGVKVYRATSSFGEYTTPALVTTLGAVLTYTDTGTAVGAGAVPLVNTATTGKMKFGIAQNTTSCVLRCDSITVRGAATLGFAAGGILAQSVSLGAQALPSTYYVVPKTGNVTGVIPAQGICSAMPILIGETGTLTQIGINVTVVGQAGALIRLGVYADTGHGLPGVLLVDAGTVAGDSLNYKETAISLPVVPGRYFLAYAAQSCATTAPTVSGTTGNVDPPIQSQTGANAATVTNYSCYQQSGITGALPSTWGAAVPAASTPRPIVKAA